MPNDVVKVELERALERCCDAHPATGSGPGSRLHPDASLMGEVLGLMIHYGPEFAQAVDVSQEAREAIARWQ